MKNYVGKIVFLERKDPTKSQYGSGEYLVVEQSPNNLFCIKPESGYGGHNIETRPLVGVEAWSVVSEHEDPAFVRRFVVQLRHFGNTAKRGEKTNWVESVYEGALRNAEKLERLFCSCDEPQKVSVYAGKTHTFLLDGHRVTVSIDA